MKHYRSTFLGILGCVLTSGSGIYAQQINPVTEAVLRDYSEILAEDPKDYYTLFDRATLYLNIGDYVRSLSDIDMAIEYTPETDKDYKVAEYSLKADILTAQKNYEGAIDALNKALAVNPTSAAELYKLGNLYLATGNPQDALRTFQMLQRENARSQDAFYGMAKAYATMGNIQEAENLMKEVENLGKQSPVTYCRIGDLYVDMGNIREATTNYSIAYTMDDTSYRPVESLKLLTKKNPETVMETLNGIITSKPDNLALKYLKAILAFDAGMYAEAEEACNDLASGLEGESSAVYRMTAMAQLAQNRIADAKASIAKAEAVSPSDPSILLDKAQILLSSEPETAYAAMEKALAANPDDESTLLTAAKAAILTGRYQEALSYLNNLVLSNPSNTEALLLRGYLNSEYIKDGKAGIADYTRASNVNPQGMSNQDLVYAALGKVKINKKLDADGMINEAIAKIGNDKDGLYLLAVYFAQTGNLEKAKEYADKAVANGYSNIYNLKANKEPFLNLSPIYHLNSK